MTVTATSDSFTLDQLRIDGEFAAEIPPTSDSDFDALCESVREQGLLQPIEVDETGTILDGHRRYHACKRLGVQDPPLRILLGKTREQKLDYMDEVNLRRRQMDPAQRREVIRKYLRRHPEVSNRQIAERAGVSPTTVGQQREDLEEAGEIEAYADPRAPYSARPGMERTDPATVQSGQWGGREDWADDSRTSSADIADHTGRVEVEVLIYYGGPPDPDEWDERKRGTGMWAMTYNREDETRKKRQIGPFAVPSGCLRQGDHGYVQLAETVGRTVFRELRDRPIEVSRAGDG